MDAKQGKIDLNHSVTILSPEPNLIAGSVRMLDLLWLDHLVVSEPRGFGEPFFFGRSSIESPISTVLVRSRREQGFRKTPERGQAQSIVVDSM